MIDLLNRYRQTSSNLNVLVLVPILSSLMAFLISSHFDLAGVRAGTPNKNGLDGMGEKGGYGEQGNGDFLVEKAIWKGFWLAC